MKKQYAAACANDKNVCIIGSSSNPVLVNAGK